MQRHLVIIQRHHVEPPMDADIIRIAGAPVQTVDILRDQPRPRGAIGGGGVALCGQPAMHIVRRHMAIGGKTPVIPQQELPRVGFIHLAGGHFLGRVIDRPDGPVPILAAKGGDAAVGADAGTGDIERCHGACASSGRHAGSDAGPDAGRHAGPDAGRAVADIRSGSLAGDMASCQPR